MSTRVPIALACAALLCAACSASDGRVDSYGQFSQPSQLAQDASAGQAVARIAHDAGQVLNVVERRADGVISQEITLAAYASSQGENKIRVAIGPLNGGDPVLAPRIGPALSSDVTAEIAKEFSGIAMRVSETMGRNSYGPFGYATGMKGNRNCLYAWQFVPELSDGEVVMLGFFEAHVSAALRVRVCKLRTPPEELVEYVAALMLALPPAQYDHGGAAMMPVTAGGDALDAVMPGY
jgi:hypothetical protein